jgi:hypothetical protein
MVSLIIILCIASAVLCHWLAGRRGADRVYWGVMGACFGPFAIPVLLLRHR